MDDYALYLDDIRYPPQTGENWILCRTVASMLELLQANGIPVLASFDYELGRTDPGCSGDDAVSAFLDFLISHPPEGEDIEVEVRLHTSSSYGAARMAQLLKQRSADCMSVGIRLVSRD
jgi:hypothetical protein